MTKQERILQQMTCEYLSLNNIFYFSIPNEHWNISFAELNALKKRGMVPGMPDLAILKNQKIYFLEFKSKNGKLSKNQQIIIDYLIAHNYDVAVVDNFDDTREMLKLWGIIG